VKINRRFGGKYRLHFEGRRTEPSRKLSGSREPQLQNDSTASSKTVEGSCSDSRINRNQSLAMPPPLLNICNWMNTIADQVHHMHLTWRSMSKYSPDTGKLSENTKYATDQHFSRISKQCSPGRRELQLASTNTEGITS
jgi:hypothetical protein